MRVHPLVSIITAVFNARDMLEECRRSVIAQKFRNYEWLIIDDQSNDNSFEILSHWRDSKIRVSRTSANTGGPAAPRNLALGLAKGDYIAILDQDDLWDADKLERQVEFMEKHREVGLLSGNLRVASHGEGNYRRPYLRKGGLIYPSADDVYRENPFLSSAIIMRRSVVDDMGGFDEHPEVRGMDEWELAIRISLKYKTAFDGSHIAGIHRFHRNNLSLSISSSAGMEFIRDKHDHHFSNSLVRDVRARDCYNKARNALIAGMMPDYREQISKAAGYRSFYRWKGLYLKNKLLILKTIIKKDCGAFSESPR